MTESQIPIPDLPVFIDQEIKINRNNFLTGISILIVSTILITYFIYNITKYYTLYREQVTGSTTQLPRTRSKINPMTDKAQDNERYNALNNETIQDQYVTITKSIQDSFKEYTTYNDQIKKYYSKVLKAPVDDVMDPAILNPLNDNYIS